MAMFENISEFFKRFMQSDKKELLAENPTSQSKDTAKDRLHIVLMQDRANVSADFLELMKEEIIEVIKKYIVVDESKIDVRLTNEENEDGSLGAPLLHANIPILNVRNDLKGSYMNGEPIDKIEGQQEISLEENREEIFEKENEVQEAQDKEANTVVPEQKTTEQQVEGKTETSQEESNSEENKSQNFTETKNSETAGENAPKEGTAGTEATDDEVDEEEDDDDVTFDDLLKAAEEEEKRLKQLQEKKEDRGDRHKKKTIQKKKKTSK